MERSKLVLENYNNSAPKAQFRLSHNTTHFFYIFIVSSCASIFYEMSKITFIKRRLKKKIKDVFCISNLHFPI